MNENVLDVLTLNVLKVNTENIMTKAKKRLIEDTEFKIRVLIIW